MRKTKKTQISGLTSRRNFLRRGMFLIGAALAEDTAAKALRIPSYTTTPMSLAHDPRRPQFHLMPAANWMNDPNGPIYWKGKYHMFYQYNPNGAYWGDMHWGHAASRDMVHWKHLGIALAPTPGGPDAAGCFTGTSVVDGDRVAVLYTGVVSVPENEATIRNGAQSLKESQCLAFSADDDLMRWTKEPKPVIAAPPAGLDVSGFRDPSPWRQGDWWYMAIGSGIRGKAGAVLLYRSQDLRHWEYLHPLLQGMEGNRTDPADSGDMWECPDFFPLGDKHVLIHSAAGKSFWQVGAFDTEQLVFHPQQSGVLDHGSFYAPKSQLDDRGNRILWGWIPETRPLEQYRAAGWAGVMSLPRVLTLDPNSHLCVSVAPALKSLRRNSQSLSISGDEEQNQRKIAQLRIRNGCGEILCTVKADNAVFHLSLVEKNQAAAVPWLSMLYDPARPGKIKLDATSVPIRTSRTGEFELHFFVDGSVIEVFVNRQAAYTKRFYAPGTSAPPLGIQMNGNTTSLSSMTVWQLSPISANRLTA